MLLQNGFALNPANCVLSGPKLLLKQLITRFSFTVNALLVVTFSYHFLSCFGECHCQLKRRYPVCFSALQETTSVLMWTIVAILVRSMPLFWKEIQHALLAFLPGHKQQTNCKQNPLPKICKQSLLETLQCIFRHPTNDYFCSRLFQKIFFCETVRLVFVYTFGGSCTTFNSKDFTWTALLHLLATILVQLVVGHPVTYPSNVYTFVCDLVLANWSE